jgi:hypothetical protein
MENPNTETHGMTENPMINQDQITTKITKDNDGFTQTWDTVGAGTNIPR